MKESYDTTLRVTRELIMMKYRIEIHTPARYELLVPDDEKKNGQPKYFRSQHMVGTKLSKRTGSTFKDKADRLHDKNIAKASHRVSRSDQRRTDRLEQRQRKKESRKTASRIR